MKEFSYDVSKNSELKLSSCIIFKWPINFYCKFLFYFFSFLEFQSSYWTLFYCYQICNLSFSLKGFTQNYPGPGNLDIPVQCLAIESIDSIVDIRYHRESIKFWIKSLNYKHDYRWLVAHNIANDYTRHFTPLYPLLFIPGHQ